MPNDEFYEVLDNCHPIVKKIHADVTDRRGWRQEWDRMDDDIQIEIIKTWNMIVTGELS